MTAEYKQELIDSKIEILYDSCILRSTRNQRIDSREEIVRDFLNSFSTEIAMENALHDVLKGTISLNRKLENWKARFN